MAFTRAYVQNTLCTPSRASFLTGRYPAAHRVFRNGDVSFPPGEVPVSRLFAGAGYRCGLVGKLHLAAPAGGSEARVEDGYETWRWSFSPRPEDGTSAHNAYHHWLRGKGIDAVELYAEVDAFVGPGAPAALHQTTWAAEEAMAFIHARRGAPWLLSVNPFAPHHPFDPAPEYLERYDAESLPHPLFRESDLARQPAFKRIQHNTVEAIDPTVRLEGDGEPVRFDGRWENCLDVGHYHGRDVKAAYYAMIEHLDWALGQLVAALEESGQRENTIVLYTSDHGELLGDHGLIFKGCRFFEGAVRVPLVIAWPAGFARGVVSPALVEEVDLAPTLLEAAGLAVPPYMQGVSLAPIFARRDRPRRPQGAGDLPLQPLGRRSGDCDERAHPRDDVVRRTAQAGGLPRPRSMRAVRPGGRPRRVLQPVGWRRRRVARDGDGRPHRGHRGNPQPRPRALYRHRRLIGKRGGDLVPLLVQRTRGGRLAGTPIPVAGVARIALDPVQVGVDPGAGGVVFGLGEAVGDVPLALGQVPQRL